MPVGGIMQLDLILSTRREIHYDDITVISFTNIKCTAAENIP